MSTNPFIITEKVIPKYFCDRKEETRQLKNLLINGNNVVFISQRRIGKTALIQYCFEQKELKKEYYLFYIDILSTTNLQEFIFLLGKEIVESIRPFGRKIVDNFINTVKSLSGKLGYDPISGVPTLNFQLGDITQPEYTLKEIFKYLGGADKPCIVAIDEFQQVAKYPEKGVEALIRSNIQQINNCRFIYAGSERHMLEQMFLSPSRPFYNSCSMMELHVIPKEVYTEFAVKLFKEFHKKVSVDIVEKVYEMFDGITFYLQRVFNNIFELTALKGEANEAMIGMALNNILSGFDTMFRERLLRLTTKQKELLFAIAAGGKVEKITSAEFIKSHSLASASAVQTAYKALLNSDIITKENNLIYIPERLFAIWLKKHYVL